MAEAFIEIRGLTKTFHTRDGDLNVLKGIDLSIDKGEIFGIIGFSGAGKSTLARCINRLEMPDSDSIHIGGQDSLALKDDQLRHRRRKLGMIFQTFNLWETKTVYENIAFPLKIAGLKRGELRDRVYSTAELVGLTEKLNAYPGGLSGGQKQRVGIARHCYRTGCATLRRGDQRPRSTNDHPNPRPAQRDQSSDGYHDPDDHP